MDCNYLIRQATEEDTSAIAAFNIRMAMETEAMVLDSKVITDGVRGMIEHPESINGRCLQRFRSWRCRRNLVHIRWS